MDGRDAAVSVRGFNEEKTPAELRAFNPVSLEVEPLALEDAFVEYVTGAERGNV